MESEPGHKQQLVTLSSPCQTHFRTHAAFPDNYAQQKPVRKKLDPIVSRRAIINMGKTSLAGGGGGAKKRGLLCRRQSLVSQEMRKERYFLSLPSFHVSKSAYLLCFSSLSLSLFFHLFPFFSFLGEAK